MALTDKLTAIGNAIREKEGSTGLIPLSDMPSRIQALPTSSDDDPVRQSVLAVANETADVNYVIPAGARKISEYMFYHRTNIKAFVYEDESLITSFDQQAFDSCSTLTSIKFPSGFTGTEIPYACFQQCSKLSLVEGMPNCVKAINPYSFAYCFDLQMTTLPESVESIHQNAFYNSFSRYSDNPPELFTIPAKVKAVGLEAFYGVGLKKIRFLGTPINIDNQAFSNSTITDIYVPWASDFTNDMTAKAPWGATNAQIHYNVSPDEVIT